MNSKQVILIFVFALFLVYSVSAEIVVNTGDNIVEESDSVTKHSFQINKYIAQQESGEFQTIMVEPIVSEKKITQCSQANFSFRLTNIAPTSQIYSFSVRNFEGIAYITPNLKLNPGNIAQIRYILEPNCTSTGMLTPEIVVETDTERAVVPVILTVNKTEEITLDPNKCETHFNTSICESNYYIRFYEDTRYELDLSKMFQDPDGDELEFGYANGFNININLKNKKAILRPNKNWHGTEEIVFTAEDGKGGYAESRTFYVHVVDKEEFSFLQWLSNLFS